MIGFLNKISRISVGELSREIRGKNSSASYLRVKQATLYDPGTSLPTHLQKVDDNCLDEGEHCHIEANPARLNYFGQGKKTQPSTL
ncbi:MAG: hypothetical protein IT308_11045 [Anaerolineaceae bacterium]|nr:hypothetical protein [Anaerolineaceae bacterium]